MKQRRRLRALASTIALSLLAACSDDAGGGGDAGPAEDVSTDPTPDADAGSDAPTLDCDTSRRPIVLVHGFLASGDTFYNHSARFTNNGYCPDWVRAFDWNSLDQQIDHEADLDAFIDDVLAATGAETVDLGGHSAGGGLGYRYLSEPDRAAKVAHYAHIASGLQDAPAGPDGDVPTLNLWSEADQVIDNKGDVDGATNVSLPNDDHYQVATTAASFEAIYTFFNDGEAPDTTDVGSDDEVTIAGRAVSLGENVPPVGGSVAIYAVDSATGVRAEATPLAEYMLTADGRWGPFDADPGQHYELAVTTEGEDGRPTHYYFEPFTRSSELIYLRTLPSPDSLAGLLLSVLPFDDDTAIVINFTASSAAIFDRDSLTIAETEVIDEAVAAPEETLIALFFFDANENMASDFTPIDAFASFPFLEGVDVYLPADATSSVEIVFNGRTLHAPRWPSDSEGPAITVFR